MRQSLTARKQANTEFTGGMLTQSRNSDPYHAITTMEKCFVEVTEYIFNSKSLIFELTLPPFILAWHDLKMHCQFI